MLRRAAWFVVSMALVVSGPATAAAQLRLSFDGGGAQRAAPMPDGLRIVAELAIAFVPAALGGATGATFGAIVPCDPDWDCDVGHARPGLLVGTAAGHLFAPGWVALGGHLLGGRGNAAGAWVGFLVGGALAAPLLVAGFAAPQRDDGWVLAGAVLAGVLTTAGSLVGYEISHLLAPRRTERRDELSVGVVPELGVSPSGTWHVGARLAAAW